MNILMMTNTFSPHVGGVARSVEAFTSEYRKRGHRVLVVAPIFENMPEKEGDVVRVPAIQHFSGSDFSVVLPIPGGLLSKVEAFKPDIIHSHHPFLIGATALRMAHVYEIPLVFTHHTMYEQYTHYVPGDSKALQRFVIRLTTSYANLCDQVFAPSDSTALVLRERQIRSPIDVVPTGVSLQQFSMGSGPGFRAAMDIPEDAFVVGHLGRLAPEKNLPFLTEALAAFLKREKRAHFLVVGTGPLHGAIRDFFAGQNLSSRLHVAGNLTQPLLASAYRAMDVFAFASKSETQGMVLIEAMAVGTPVIALDAPGSREVVVDGSNGLLLHSETVAEFSSALQRVASFPRKRIKELKENAYHRAELFTMERSTDKALSLYGRLLKKDFEHRDEEYDAWSTVLRLIKTEWDLLKGVVEGGARQRSFYPGKGGKGPLDFSP